MAVGTVTINSSGVGGTQSGTVVLSDQSLAEKSFTRVTGLANGAQTLVSVTNSHGTSAQNAEIIYITLASA
mgnify:CR=1 FL=1